MDLYQRGKVWWCDFAVGGKRYRKSTGKRGKTAAMTAAVEMLREAEAGDSGVVIKKIPTLNEFLATEFTEFIKSNRNLSANGLRYYLTGLRLLGLGNMAATRIDRVTTGDAELLQFPGGGSTANCALRTLRRALSLARDRGYMQVVPRIKMRKEKERTAVFTAEFEKAFIDIAPQPLRDVFLIVQDSGMRPEEVIRMRWENVLWDKNLIFIPHGKTEKSRRHVPLSDRVRNLLRVRAGDSKSEWVFPSKRRGRGHISYFPVAKSFAKCRKDAGLPEDLVLYSARHSFATDMLDKTGNLVLVGNMLGHRSVTTTQRYLHPQMKDLAELVNRRNTENDQRHNLRHSRELVQ